MSAGSESSPKCDSGNRQGPPSPVASLEPDESGERGALGHAETRGVGSPIGLLR